MAHTKAGGSTKLGRDSASQRLGVKRSEGQLVNSGEVLVRQRGTKILAGKNIGIGKDHTLFALKDGIVKFTEKRKTGYDGRVKKRKVANVK